MKKRIYLLITLILSLFVFSGRVEANNDNNMAMWLDCDYKVYEEDAKKIETGRPLVFIGGWRSNTEFVGYYRLLNPLIFEEHSPALNVWYDSDNPLFDPSSNNISCWFYDPNDIGKSCNDEDAKKYSKTEALSMLRKGICPAIIRDSNGTWSNEAVVFAGQGDTNNVYRLTNQYRFYKDNQAVYAYGYDINGYFVQSTNGKFVKSYDEKTLNIATKQIVSVSASGVERYGREFMNVAELDYNAMLIPSSAEVVFDGKKNISKLYSAVDNWYTKYGTSLSDKSNKMNQIESDYSQTIKSCSDLNNSYDNGREYVFNNNYTAALMLEDLKKLYSELSTFYNIYSNEKVNQYEMCVSSSTTTDAIFSAYNCSMVELLGGIDYIPEELQEFVMNDINEYLSGEKEVYLDKTSDNEGVLNTVLKCSSYIDIHHDDFKLDKSETSDISSKYAELGKDRGITFVYDCESLLGSDLINKINSYLDIIKIAIPIILIGFGIIDFTKAIFLGEDDMKKAQKNFITRIFIAVLIFLTPTIVNLILKIANVVWENISPNSCGLF